MFSGTRCTREVLWAGGEAERVGALVEGTLVFVGRSSGASKFRDFDEARLLDEKKERKFCINRCFFENRSSSWGADMAMRVSKLLGK